MAKSANWPVLLLCGTLWGLSELIAGSALYAAKIPSSSVLLTAWALLLLGLARGVVNKPGSSTLVGGVATLYKLAFTAPFFCHLLAIFLLGVAFDAAATIFLRNERRELYKSVLTGIVGAYGGYAIFAFSITYVFRYSYWIKVGMPKVMHHILSGGTFAALTACVLVPLGYWAGRSAELHTGNDRRWAYGSGLVTFALWALGFVIR